MLVKDEADVIQHTLRHLLAEVDHVLVADNLSTDGTWEALEDLRADVGSSRLSLLRDEDPAYYQSVKTTALAQTALELGARWVIPCDADEVWYAPDGRSVAAYLNGVAPDVQIVKADLYNHLPSALDPPAACPECGTSGLVPGPAEPVWEGPAVAPPLMHVPGPSVVCPTCQGRVEPNPLRRIGWRQRERGALPKVCARARPDLVIHAGNHGASTSGTALAVPGLVIRHFTWRSPEQYATKIENGARAYAATDLPGDVGAHWRMFGDPDAPDFRDRVMEHYRQWFWTGRPYDDASLIYDPAPLGA
jgi:hypothetical protein